MDLIAKESTLQLHSTGVVACHKPNLYSVIRVNMDNSLIPVIRSVRVIRVIGIVRITRINFIGLLELTDWIVGLELIIIGLLVL